jgi:hypothetical protein
MNKPLKSLARKVTAGLFALLFGLTCVLAPAAPALAAQGQIDITYGVNRNGVFTPI